MNLQKASILLDTINALFKRMEMNNGNVPAIERDLMLQNVRELYEFFVTNAATATVSKPINPPQKNTTRPVSSSPVREVPSYRVPEPEPKIEATPPNAVRKVERNSDYKPPRIIELPDDFKTEIPISSTTPTYSKPEPVKYTPPPPPKPVPVPTPKPVPTPTLTPTPTPPATVAEDTPEFDTLFEHKVAKELSEKLGERPIADLTRAVGYNDKMLYTNELFGGELVAFNSAVSRINSMSSFKEARKHLAKLAEQNNWTSPKKTSSAKSFIKLVRRRFGA